MNSPNLLPLACPECAVQMPETAAFCPGCGRSMAVAAKAEGKVGRLPETLAGALAYITFIPAIIFLLRATYKTNRYVRFHSIQCLLLWVAGLATAAAIRLLGILLYIIPVAGPLLTLLITVIVGLAAFVLWLVLIVKALQGEMFKLPVLGDFAEQQAETREA